MLVLTRGKGHIRSVPLDWTEAHYRNYFHLLWNCLNSNHPTLFMPWVELFAHRYHAEDELPALDPKTGLLISEPGH
ncbi:hypothetical protein DL93DRAFT_2084157 [Clavulina sp. PMI_390]|nr:hypothetical protein DL93DRAFT_2084157 [Clavulina sp. PMI_390]